MEKILDNVDEIGSALQSDPSQDLHYSSEELDKHLEDLKQHAERCTKDTGSVVEKFGDWQSKVTKIIPLPEVQGSYISPHVESF